MKESNMRSCSVLLSLVSLPLFHPIITSIFSTSLMHVNAFTAIPMTINNHYHQTMRTSKVYNSLFPREEEEEDDDDDIDNDENQLSETKGTIDEARQRFEDLLSIPNDNLSTSSSSINQHHHSSTSHTNTNSTPSSSTSSSPTSSTFSSSNPQSQNQSQQQQYQRQQTLSHTLATLSSTIPPPPLTTIQRQRKTTELQLLHSLLHSDDAINDLWALWFAERGPTSATLLLRAEDLVSQGGENKWNEAEEILWMLIQQHGIYWVEPMNRLATLKYMQGKWKESKELCELVLNVKPWHFGALSGIVLVCAALNDVTEAKLWADKRLPPLTTTNSKEGSRRMLWVHRACRDAEASLNDAEILSNNNEQIAQDEVEFRTFRMRLQKSVDLDSMDRGGNVVQSGDSFTKNDDDDSSWQ